MNPLLQKPVADSASKSLSPLKFVRPPQTKGDNDYALVTVSTKKLDAEWARDTGFYVGPQGTGDAIGGRYQRFIEWRRDNPDTPVEAPIVSWNEYTNSVSFTNGRHRFSVLRDQGYPKVQVLVPKSQLNLFRKMAADGCHRFSVLRKKSAIQPIDEPSQRVSSEFFILLNNLIYGRGKKRLGWQWAKQIDPEMERYLDSLDFAQDGFKLVTTTDHQFTRGRAKIGEFNGWNLSRDAEQEQALQKLWIEGQSIWRSPLDKTAKSGPHENASTQINLPDDAAAKMREASMRIPDEDLGTDGREDEPHVTLKYGVKNDIDLVSQAVASQKPFIVTLGKTHVFEAGTISEGQSPVVVEARAPELEALHDLLNKTVGTREDDFPEYRPHATLAYVRPEIASKYEGLDWVEGVSFPVNRIVLSGKGSARTIIPFGQKAASHKTPPMSDTQYEPSGEYGQGQETNAYADIPERVKGEEDLPSLEELSPDLFKTGAGVPSLHDVVYWGIQADFETASVDALSQLFWDESLDSLPQEQQLPAVKQRVQREWARTVKFLKKFQFPLTVYRGIGTDDVQNVLTKTVDVGTAWTYSESSEYIRKHKGIGGPHRNKHFIILRGKVVPEAVDWDSTAYHLLVWKEEKEITLQKNAAIQVTGWRYSDKNEWNVPSESFRQVTAATTYKFPTFEEYAATHDISTNISDHEEYAHREYLYDEIVAGLDFDFPLTVYRALDIPVGEQPNYESTGVYWTTDLNSADAYYGEGSIWSPAGKTRDSKKMELVLLEAKVLKAEDVDWQGTLEANVLNPDENEVTIISGVRLRLMKINGEPVKKRMITASKLAYGDASKNLPMRGQKGIGGQDFPVLEEEEVFPEKMAASFGTGAGTQLTPDENEIVAELGDLGISGNSRALPELEKVPLFPEDKEGEDKIAKGKKRGEVYLLHFNVSPDEVIPSSREDAYTKKFHARHYLGFAEGVGGAQRRIEQHYQATSGVKLIDAIHAKGITFTVARIWEKKDRNFERQLKNQGGLSRHCPICKKLGIDRDSLYRKQVPAMSEGIQTVEKETQVAPAEPEHGPDFVEQEKVIPKTAYPSAKIAQEADEAVSHVFYIEVPPDARDAFWREPPEGKLEFWAFKGRPSVLPNETVYFTFDKVPVGETTVYKLEPPGQSACGETGDFLKYWKLLWLPSAFKKYASMIL